MLRVLCLLAVIFGVQSASAPFIKPCKKGDTACYVASAQAAVPAVAPGVPELGIAPLDPMRLDLIKGDQAGLQLTFRDTTMTGMKGCHVDNVKFDTSKAKQAITIRCDVELAGHYTLGGRLLLLPVQGDGKYNIKIRDIVIKTFADLVVQTGADGAPHWHIAAWRHSYSVNTGTHFHFDNLFNGNKLLAEPVEQFANANWREVMSEVAPPIVQAIVSRVVDAVEALYKAVPVDELMLP